MLEELLFLLSLCPCVSRALTHSEYYPLDGCPTCHTRVDGHLARTSYFLIAFLCVSICLWPNRHFYQVFNSASSHFVACPLENKGTKVIVSVFWNTDGAAKWLAICVKSGCLASFFYSGKNCKL